MRHNIIYKVKNLINEKFYIGVHSTDNLDDGYLGSGLVLNRSIRKYGIESFSRSILFNFDNREEALKMERILVDFYFCNQPDVYNIKRGGEGGAEFGHIVSNKTRKKIGKANTGRIPTAETLQKMKDNHKGMKGKKHSEKTKQKIKESNEKTWANEELRQKHGNDRRGNHWNKGYVKTKEHRQKLSNALIGKKKPKQSEETKLKRTLSIRIAYAQKKENISRVILLQNEYKKLFGNYHHRYMKFMS